MNNSISDIKPPWLRRGIEVGGRTRAVEGLLAAGGINTVCAEARCPNRGECFRHGTATFLILGNTCTRSCSFCAITHGMPSFMDESEPGRIAGAVHAMGLNYAVVTSVTRDDLPDGGAAHFAATIRAIREMDGDVKIEVLVPDFKGDLESLATVVEAGPDVLNHNVETVPRLYASIRPQAGYRRSLELLSNTRTMDPSMKTKSGIMVGLGESPQEVVAVLADLRRVGCAIVTIGQYLRPSREQAVVCEYVLPEQFDVYRAEAMALGFAQVLAGPFVRSSYHAAQVFQQG